MNSDATDALAVESPDYAAVDGARAPDEAAVEEAVAQAADASASDATDSTQAEPLESPMAVGFATPKVAGLDYTNDTSAARKALLARHKLVLLGLLRTMSTTTLSGMVGGIKALNPNIKIGQYVLVNEAQCSPSSTHPQYPLVQEINKNNWWLRKADGTRVQWTTAFGACDVNVTSWTPKNSAGQTWMQYKWKQDKTQFFDRAPFQYVFIDNFWGTPRTDADYKRIRTNQSKNDPAIQSAMRAGLENYVNAVRATNPSLKVMGNVNHDLAYAEHAEVLDGAFMEGIMGRSWSLETWAGWQKAMDRYRAVIRNTRSPNDVIFQVFASPTDYKLVRYGLASALMDNGYFMYIPATGSMQPKWFDEFSAPLGDAIESPPTAPAQNGIWRRRYSNGLVLVNPSKAASATINVGAGYKRLTGTQDPAVNNGAVQSSVTLGPRQGLIMIKQ